MCPGLQEAHAAARCPGESNSDVPYSLRIQSEKTRSVTVLQKMFAEGMFGFTMVLDALGNSVQLLAQQGAAASLSQAAVDVEQGLLERIDSALESLFGDPLLTFNVFFGQPNAVAMSAMIVALVYLIFGWRIFKVSLVLSGLLIGSVAGFMLGDWLGRALAMNVRNTSMIGAVVLALLLGGLAIPFVKLMVFIFCGVCGASLVSYLCERAGVGSSLLWTLGSFVLVGLISVFLIKYAMILFTSLLGAYTLVAGAAALLYNWRHFSVSTRLDLVWPTIAWVVLFLVGIRAQTTRAAKKST